ncbi:MAG TPA: hypothetical protein DGC76_04655, partial [Candidatus Accumulibacter sp.]|nr:hypothetical protein [Accumulibacter sp.]
GDAALDAEALVGERRGTALEAVSSVRGRWQWLLDHLDLPLAEAEKHFDRFGIRAGPLRNRAPAATLFHRLQDYSVRASWKTELRPQLAGIFDGGVYRPVLEELETIQRRVLRSRLL